MKKKKNKLYFAKDCLHVADEIASLYNDIVDGSAKVSGDETFSMSKTDIKIKSVSYTFTKPKKRKSTSLAGMMIDSATALLEGKSVNLWNVTVTPFLNAPKLEKEGGDVAEILLKLRKQYIKEATKDAMEDYLPKDEYRPYVEKYD